MRFDRPANKKREKSVGDLFFFFISFSDDVFLLDLLMSSVLSATARHVNKNRENVLFSRFFSVKRRIMKTSLRKIDDRGYTLK